MFQESFRRLSRKIEACVEGVLRMFQGHFKTFYSCLDEVFMMFYESFNGVAKKVSSLTGVSREF